MNFKLICVCAILVQTIAQALPHGNGPYNPAKHPPTVPLQKLEFVKQTEDIGSYRSADSQAELRLFNKGENVGLFLEIIRDGQVRFPKRFMCWSGGIDYGSAYQADLNQDGQPDYVLEYATGGNGIPPVYVTFLLSTGKEYTLTCTTSYFEENDFILIQGNPRMILSEMLINEPCNDGKDHSFWIYNLLGFDKGEVKIDNSGAPFFPKIVWYSDAPNHQETTLLSPEQKAELIRHSQSGWQETFN